MNNHFILDFETFGQNVFTCPVINCAMYIFDWDRFTTNPYTFEELVRDIRLLKLDVTSQVKEHGCVIEKSSIDFWSSMPSDVKAQIKPKKDDISVLQFCEIVLDYLKDKDIQYWWSRSNTFDPVILNRLFKYYKMSLKLDESLKYWRVRDTRTYYDAKFFFELKSNGFIPIDDHVKWNEIFHKHDSVHDLAAEVLRLQKITQVENNYD